MSTQLIWELIGYLGSALVLISLLMTSIVKLRVINALGSLIFCIYAFKIRSIPTAFMNVALVGIDLYFLFKLTKAQSTFTTVEASSADSTVQHLLSTYNSDIAQYFPGYDLSGADRFFVTFDKDTAAGLTAVSSRGSELEIIIDYSTPMYRDCKVAQCLNSYLTGKYKRLIYTGSNEEHIAYVLKMGYEKHGEKYIKNL